MKIEIYPYNNYPTAAVWSYGIPTPEQLRFCMRSLPVSCAGAQCPRDFATTQIYCSTAYIILYTDFLTKYLLARKVAWKWGLVRHRQVTPTAFGQKICRNVNNKHMRCSHTPELYIEWSYVAWPGANFFSITSMSIAEFWTPPIGWQVWRHHISAGHLWGRGFDSRSNPFLMW
jgi:hypothetical protein